MTNQIQVDDSQKRAKAGGEYGPNGEWYKGGTWIATTDHPKTAPTERGEFHPLHDAHVIAYRQNWRAERAAKFAEYINRFTANPGSYAGYIVSDEQWAKMLEYGHAGFHADLARQLKLNGRLSPRQAEYFAKAVFGRRTKKNEKEFEALVEDLIRSDLNC